MEMFEKLFNKKDNVEEIEEPDLIQFEIDLRLAEMADLNWETDADKLQQLGKHVAELQKVLNEKQRIQYEHDRDEHKLKTLLTPELAGKAVLTVVSLGSIYMLQRGGMIDRAMEKFIPRSF